MPIIEDLARALAWKAHEAVDLILRHTGESVTQVESEIEKGFDSVDVGVEPTEDDDE
ncbi:hypothetical protein [Paraburkholderia sediminicola]|uniref:hypothetical protein n=1 Tax=Paraburkholderia sediminicola TaxID=458836 RepID=UPI0038BAC91D